jgi:hypothetical protein
VRLKMLEGAGVPQPSAFEPGSRSGIGGEVRLVGRDVACASLLKFVTRLFGGQRGTRTEPLLLVSVTY